MTVSTGSLRLNNGCQIDSSTFGTGNAGNVNVNVSGATTINPGPTGNFTALSSETQLATAGAGNGGDVTLSTNSLVVRNGGLIDAGTLGTGNGGNVNVTVSGATTINAGASDDFTGIFSNTEMTTAGAGRGGSVALPTHSLEISNGGEIDASTLGTGNAGNASIGVIGAATIDAQDTHRYTAISSESELATSARATVEMSFS